MVPALKHGNKTSDVNATVQYRILTGGNMSIGGGTAQASSGSSSSSSGPTPSKITLTFVSPDSEMRDGDYFYVAPGQSYRTQSYNEPPYSFSGTDPYCDTNKPVYVASGWDGTLCFYYCPDGSVCPNSDWIYTYHDGSHTSVPAILSCPSGDPPYDVDPSGCTNPLPYGISAISTTYGGSTTSGGSDSGRMRQLTTMASATKEVASASWSSALDSSADAAVADADGWVALSTPMTLDFEVPHESTGKNEGSSALVLASISRMMVIPP